MPDNKIILELDPDDVTWLLADLIKRRDAVPSVTSLLKKMAKGSKLKAELEKLQSESDHMLNLILDIQEALPEGYLRG